MYVRVCMWKHRPSEVYTKQKHLDAMAYRHLVFGPGMLLLSAVPWTVLYFYTQHSPSNTSTLPSTPHKNEPTSVADASLFIPTRNEDNVPCEAREDGDAEPGQKYEAIRRHLRQIAREQGFYLSSKLNALSKISAKENINSDIEEIIRVNKLHQRALLVELEAMGRFDGYEAWRVREAAQLSALVQRRLSYLQNPKDCSTARKLLCQLDKYVCGFGCLLHRIANCLMVAYRTQRTLILNSSKLGYLKDGWEGVYLPLSNTCLDSNGTSYSLALSESAEAQVVDYSGVTTRIPSSSSYPPFVIPEDLASRLKRVHGQPFAWWVGQMLKYLTRPQQRTAHMLKEAEIKMGFKKPIVGVHIRRTDKIMEAKYFPVERYMAAVEEYYNALQVTQEVPVRRIYLATDEPLVISEMQQKYPHYEILADPVTAKTASKMLSRYNDDSFTGILIDIHLLSSCDYLVCTFSSNFCRLVYEIMQTYHTDAADRIRSLDSTYLFYTLKEPHNYVAIYPHKAQSTGEIQLKVGDIIDVYKNNWNGFSQGRNRRLNITGTFPSFKVMLKVDTQPFPTYPEASVERERETLRR